MMMTTEVNIDFYDKILDKYQDVGIDGMEPDEIEYLKSGGTSKIPAMFLEKEDIVITNYKVDFMRKIVNQCEHTTHILEDKDKNEIMFIVKIVYNEKIHNKLLEIFGGTDVIDEKGDEFKIRVKDNKIGIGLPISWRDQLFGDEIC